jgi:hypothetical protein
METRLWRVLIQYEHRWEPIKSIEAGISILFDGFWETPYRSIEIVLGGANA